METSIFWDSGIGNEVKQLDEGYQKTYRNFDELLPTLPRVKGWWFQEHVQYQGFWLTSTSVRGSMLIHDHFNPRPTDIVVATSPKCGTTWLRALVFSTVNRHSLDLSNHPLRQASPQELVIFLDALIHGDGSTSFIDGFPSPRLLSTHLPYSLFPERMTDDSSACRFVYICRDPKDVFVSKWHFANKLRPKEVAPLTLEEAFDMFCKGASYYGPFWDHVLGYWKASLESPKKVLFLKYEDVKKQPWDCVRKVAEFTGAPFSQEEEDDGVVEEIVKLCSFDNLRNQDVNKSEARNRERPFSNSAFFRKGEVGDWVNHLTPEMVETLDHITQGKFQGSGLSFH